MSDREAGRAGTMTNPPHPGELIRESMDEVGWSATETATRLGCERGTLSPLLNGKASVSGDVALALEDIGWGTAGHWMRMLASYDLVEARRARTAAQGDRQSSSLASIELTPREVHVLARSNATRTPNLDHSVAHKGIAVGEPRVSQQAEDRR